MPTPTCFRISSRVTGRGAKRSRNKGHANTTITSGQQVPLLLLLRVLLRIPIILSEDLNVGNNAQRCTPGSSESPLDLFSFRFRIDKSNR